MHNINNLKQFSTSLAGDINATPTSLNLVLKGLNCLDFQIMNNEFTIVKKSKLGLKPGLKVSDPLGYYKDLSKEAHRFPVVDYVWLNTIYIFQVSIF